MTNSVTSDYIQQLKCTDTFWMFGQSLEGEDLKQYLKHYAEADDVILKHWLYEYTISWDNANFLVSAAFEDQMIHVLGCGAAPLFKFYEISYFSSSPFKVIIFF